MEKKYIIPTITVYTVEAVSDLAVTSVSFGSGTKSGSDAASRDIFWDEEEE